MGQYFKIVNLDKGELLHPHDFDDGLKLTEFGYSGNGTMAGLAALLADSNGKGLGDIKSDSPLIGSWAGDRIVITGDYEDEGLWLHDLDDLDGGKLTLVSLETGKTVLKKTVNLYEYAGEVFENIGPKLIAEIGKSEDSYDHLRGESEENAEDRERLRRALLSDEERGLEDDFNR